MVQAEELILHFSTGNIRHVYIQNNANFYNNADLKFYFTEMRVKEIKIRKHMSDYTHIIKDYKIHDW